MSHIFEITDKTGRKIRLTKEQFDHIKRDHPLVDEDEMKHTLINHQKLSK